jgi:alpha/beta superfamily hydrolase
MRKLYIAVAVSFVGAVLLFIASFIYLDSSKHFSAYYAISHNNIIVGTVKVDRFDTEDKMVYKSVADTPFEQDFTETKTRLELDKKYDLQTYAREKRGPGAPEIMVIENKADGAYFLSKFQTSFIYIKAIPIKSDTLIFDEHSIISYLPLIENYNFKKGRAQGFNGLLIVSSGLPPMKKIITATSIRDEYIRIGQRSIKTENIIIRIRNRCNAAIWVAKSDKSLIRLEIPDEKIKIERIFKPIEMEPLTIEMSSEGYSSEDVVFEGKNVKLAGTMTAPDAEGSFPALLMIPPPGPEDREYYGLFTRVADHLSRNGFCTLRFDKRGTGQSTGDASSHAMGDETEDLRSALAYLAKQKKVDPSRIAILSQGDGAFEALRLAADNEAIKAAVLISPYFTTASERFKNDDFIGELTQKNAWSNDYMNLIAKCYRDTSEQAGKTGHNWTYVMGKMCYVKELKEEPQAREIYLKNIMIPVLIMQGKNESDMTVDASHFIAKILEGSGNNNCSIRYYGYLGRFLGKKVDDGAYKVYYETDKDVLNNIKDWLNSCRDAPK